MKKIIICLACALLVVFTAFGAPRKKDVSEAETTQNLLYRQSLDLYKKGNIEQAKAIWKQTMDVSTTDVTQRARMTSLLQMAEYAEKKIANPEDVERKMISASDTGSADVAPLATGDELTIYFTSRRKNPLGEKMYKQRGIYADNVYRATRTSYTSNEWEVELLGPPVSSHDHDGTAGISADGRNIFVYKGSSDFGFFEMDPIKGTVYMDLKKKYPSLKLGDAHISSIAVSEDERIVIYSAYELEGGYGESDLWLVEKDVYDGSYGEPVNLGPTINTLRDEISVSMTPDGKTIFFASDGHPTMGGYDIYRSRRIGDSVWETPVNLGHPINTTANDIYYFSVATNPKHGYYSSENPYSKGVYDIYYVDILSDILSDTEKAAMEKAAADKAEAERLEKERIALEARKQTESEARKREEKLKAEAAARDAAAREREEQLRLAAALREAEAAAREAQMKADYAAREDSIKNAAANREAELLAKKGYQDINSLTDVKVGDKVILKNVFFEIGKATILPESYAELEKVYVLLVNNPNIRLEVSGHTDNTGRRATNMKLSEGRAQSVTTYLKAKGINPGRLSVKGYGPDVPIESNESTLGRSLNRRVEFIVIK
ncbi:MAG: OmpA family protein [Bacteroidales bacterium]|jgi:outer membrane protein OmpA-like peptidoglycan-associated protein|nr:OmpA family protein [Bacteroidales bacterium]